FFQAEDGIRDPLVTGVQTCALPIFVGGGPPLVVGAALTAKTLGRGTVAVSFTGDGGSNQGTTFEAMNMAVVLKLPAIFVFENNQVGRASCRDRVWILEGPRKVRRET